MPPTTVQKRKLPFGGLQRRVRARRDEPEPELEEYSDDSQDEGSEDGDSDDVSDGEARNASESDSASGSEYDDEEDDPSSAVAQISFGALAKAQASMPSIRKKKKGRRVAASDEDEDQDGNEPEHKDNDGHDPSRSSKPPKPKPKPSRAHKHAPTEMSSKRMVSRKREVVSAPRAAPRDPRFSSASSGPPDEARARRAYAFLDEYRDAEMAQLREAIKKCKSPSEKDELARALKSMQSRREAQARKDKERELVARHRKHEKELVAKGKRPYYLKRSEQKRQLLLERFEGMGKKQVDKVIERRRKKLTAKERKNMPAARRGGE